MQRSDLVVQLSRRRLRASPRWQKRRRPPVREPIQSGRKDSARTTWARRTRRSDWQRRKGPNSGQRMKAAARPHCSCRNASVAVPHQRSRFGIASDVGRVAPTCASPTTGTRIWRDWIRLSSLAPNCGSWVGATSKMARVSVRKHRGALVRPAKPLPDRNLHVDRVARLRQWARPGRVVRAGRVVREVEVEHE